MVWNLTKPVKSLLSNPQLGDRVRLKKSSQKMNLVTLPQNLVGVIRLVGKDGCGVEFLYALPGIPSGIYYFGTFDNETWRNLDELEIISRE